MADGFDDYAFVYQFLDGEHAAFSSGDIGRLYWDKVKCLRRNVLYLKPGAVLMLDTAVPGDIDVDVTLLYQTQSLEDIHASEDVSTITKNGNTMRFIHLSPEYREVKSVETPHYLYTLRREKPLVKEGMLTVTARTDRNPLVMANLITMSTNVKYESGDGFVSGSVDGIPFAFSTSPGRIYEVNGFTTDAAAITWKADRIFAALCTKLSQNGKILLESEKPATFEISDSGIRYCLAEESELSLGSNLVPADFESKYGRKGTGKVRIDSERGIFIITLNAGEGEIKSK